MHLHSWQHGNIICLSFPALRYESEMKILHKSAITQRCRWKQRYSSTCFIHYSLIKILWNLYIYKRVKWSCPGVVQGMDRGIALLFHDHGTRRGWAVSSTPQPHFTPGKDPVPILQEAGWAPGPVWTGRKFRRHRDSIPDLLAHSQSLYRLTYPTHTHIYIYIYTHRLHNIYIGNLLRAWNTRGGESHYRMMKAANMSTAVSSFSKNTRFCFYRKT